MNAEIVKEEDYGSAVKITVKVEHEGKEYKERFGFSKKQVIDDRWKGHVEKWVEDIKQERKESFEGQTLK